MKKLSQYCQKCRAANEPGEAHCLECGTPLMIVVYPPSIRHDEFNLPANYEHHLLERISLLEIRIMQLTETLSLAMDIVREHGKLLNNGGDLASQLFKLFEMLTKEQQEKAEPVLKKILDEHDAKSVTEMVERRIAEIIAESKNPEMLKRLLREAVGFFAEKDERRAFAALKRAALNSPENVPLLLFYAEHLFYADKFDEAKEKIEAARKIEPENEKIRLLLGAIYADELETKKAFEILDFATEDILILCATDNILGMCAAFELNWEDAAAYFEDSLQKLEFAETFYLLGCVYFQLGQFENAAMNLEKAAAKRRNYSDALFMQNLVGTLLKKQDVLETAVNILNNSPEPGAQCVEFLRGRPITDLQMPLAFMHFTENRRLLTGGAMRVRNMFHFFISRIFSS